MSASMSDYEHVVRRFADRIRNPKKNNAVRWSRGNIFCNGRVLYSYGTHFPMAVYLGKNTFLINSDKYSKSTSYHQSLTSQYCQGPKTSFNCLSDVIDPREIKANNIVAYKYNDIIFRIKRKYYLEYQEDKHYFIVQLPKKPKDFDDAYEMILPPQILELKKQKVKVEKQDEYWFIPTGMNDRAFARFLQLPVETIEVVSRPSPLPTERKHYYQICRHTIMPEGIFAKGKVYHKIGDHLSNLYQSLKLGQEWHRVLKLPSPCPAIHGLPPFSITSQEI